MKTAINTNSTDVAKLLIFMKPPSLMQSEIRGQS